MAGRVAEEMIFGREEVTSGASSDLKQASTLAFEMVKRWGMSEELGPQYLEKGGGGGGGGGDERGIGGKMQGVIDQEVKKILVEEEKRAREILGEHRKELEALAHALLEYETLSGEEVDVILGGGKLVR